MSLRIVADSEIGMSRAYSEDLRIRLVRLVEGGTSARSAAKLFGLSASTAIKWMQRWRREKSVAPSLVRGHPRALLEDHTVWLLEMVEEKSGRCRRTDPLVQTLFVPAKI